MNRRKFITSAGSLGALLALHGTNRSLAAPNSPPNNRSLFKGTPAVFAPTGNSLTVTFPLNSAALVWLEFGETENLGNTANSDPFGSVPHDDKVIKFTLRNLKPGTRYFWRGVAKPLSGGDEIRTRIYQSKTIAPGATKTQFSVWNDTHDHAATIGKLHSLRRSGDDFLFWNGDLSNNVNDRDLLPGLYVSPKEADLAEGPPILLSRGNHDVRGIWANKMNDYVDFPGNRPFYAFRSGPVAAIVLDTGEDKPDSHPSFRGVAAFEPLIHEQAEWLKSVTNHPSIRTAPYRIVFCHIPLRWIDEKPVDYDNKGFDRYSLRGRNAWAGTLAKWGAQIIISGHTHRATWLPPVPEFPFGQLIGGGPQMERATIIHGDADPKKLTLQLKSLETGKLIEEILLNPLNRLSR